MTDYLTNDEMCISAFLGVATPTFFINDGNRRNAGEKVLIFIYFLVDHSIEIFFLPLSSYSEGKRRII
jgi:hypothetical protein